MRILITGGRSWEDRETIMHALIDATRGVHWEEVTVIVGGARGADTIAEELARAFGMNIELHKARWKDFGRAAGPIRNQEMVDSGADTCLAFMNPGSIGTADCVKRARKAGIPITIYHADREVEHFE